MATPEIKAYKCRGVCPHEAKTHDDILLHEQSCHLYKRALMNNCYGIGNYICRGTCQNCFDDLWSVLKHEDKCIGKKYQPVVQTFISPENSKLIRHFELRYKSIMEHERKI